MDFIGKWKFHSIGVFSDNDELVYLTAEEYLASPMFYIDETDEDYLYPVGAFEIAGK